MKRTILHSASPNRYLPYPQFPLKAQFRFVPPAAVVFCLAWRQVGWHREVIDNCYRILPYSPSVLLSAPGLKRTCRRLVKMYASYRMSSVCSQIRKQEKYDQFLFLIPPLPDPPNSHYSTNTRWDSNANRSLKLHHPRSYLPRGRRLAASTHHG